MPLQRKESGMKEEIRQIFLSLGADVCGIASIDCFAHAPQGFSPTDVFASCKSVIAFGIALPRGLTRVAPRLVYGHFNDQVCHTVDAVALAGAKALEESFSMECVPLPCDAPNEYWDAPALTAKGIISMKHAGMLCGLGSLGKSTLLINPRYGNLLIIGAVLTDAPLASDPLCDDLCLPGCERCIASCPVQAIGPDLASPGCFKVNQAKCRPHTYGKTARGFDTVDCNLCRTSCPLRFGIADAES